MLFSLSVLASEGEVSLQATEFDRIGPKEVPQKEGKILESSVPSLPEKSPEKSAESPQLMGPQLVGVLLGANTVSAKELRGDRSGVHVLEGLYVPDREQLEEDMGSLLGRAVTIDYLKEIKHAVVRYYRSCGYPLVAVSIPAGQDITDGVIFVRVEVATLGKVKVEGARYFSEEHLKKQVSLHEGDKIASSVVIADLTWLNNNPFRLVNIFYEQGDALGQTDLVLEVHDRFPLRIYGGYQNSGNQYTEEARWLGGFNWGNVFGWDHQLSAQYISSPNTHNWRGYSFDYVAPLPWRHTISFFGSYVISNPNFGPSFGIEGKSCQLSARYTIPLPVVKKIRQEVFLGYDFKQTNNFTDFFNVPVTDTLMDISQFLLGYNGTLDDKRGVTSLSASIYWGPGGMTHHNHSHDFSAERVGVRSQYIYGRINLDRITRLPMNFSWVCSGMLQQSSGELLPSEQVALGGYLSIRGYDENLVNGDRGYLVKNEIRTPPISILNWLGCTVQDELQGIFFHDYGVVRGLEMLTPNSVVILSSFGPGLRYTVGPYVNVRFDCGWQLHNPDVPKRNTRQMHVGLVVSF